MLSSLANLLRSKQIMSVLTVSAGKAGVAVVALVTAALVAQGFGQVGLGVFALLRVAPAVFTVVTDPGFSHAIPYLSGNQKIDRPTLMASGFWFYLVIALLQVCLWALLTPLIHTHLLQPLSLPAVYTAAALAPMQSITILLVNLLRSNGRYNLANNVFLFTEILLLGFIALTIFRSDTDMNNLVVYIAASSLTVILGFGVFLVRGIRLSALSARLSVIVKGVKFGLKSQIGNAFQILNYRLDHLLLAIYLTPDKVAVYFIATKAIEFFRFFTTSIMFVFEPIFATHKHSDAINKVIKMIAPTLIGNFVLIFIGICFAPFLYPIVFGDWSSAATAPLLVLSIGLSISGANTLFAAYFQGQGRPEIMSLASVVGLLVTGALAVVLIPKFEVLGAAWASTVTYAVVTIMYIILFRTATTKGSAEREDVK